MKIDIPNDLSFRFFSTRRRASFSIHSACWNPKEGILKVLFKLLVKRLREYLLLFFPFYRSGSITVYFDHVTCRIISIWCFYEPFSMIQDCSFCQGLKFLSMILSKNYCKKNFISLLPLCVCLLRNFRNGRSRNSISMKSIC